VADTEAQWGVHTVYKFRIGDVVSTQAQGDSLVSKGIQWATKSWGEPATFASHTAIVINNTDTLAEVCVLETTSPRIQTVSLKKAYLDKGANVRIYRNKRLGAGDQEKILNYTMMSGPYGFSKIIIFLLSSLISKVLSLPFFLLSRLWGSKEKGFELQLFVNLLSKGQLVCSQFVAKIFHEVAGISFGRFWAAETPDSIDDWITERLKWDWQEIKI
jgi:hypothetical protein